MNKLEMTWVMGEDGELRQRWTEVTEQPERPSEQLLEARRSRPLRAVAGLIETGHPRRGDAAKVAA